jgi:hypothetical protein
VSPVAVTLRPVSATISPGPAASSATPDSACIRSTRATFSKRRARGFHTAAPGTILPE